MRTIGAARYDAIADRYAVEVGDRVDDPATAALLSLLPPLAGLRLLEMACGEGRVARELARRGARVVGSDISEALLATAKRVEAERPLRISYLSAEATDPDAIGEEPFDGVVCNFGLSDIDDLERALSTISRCLAPDGWFAFSILHPCFPGWDADAPSSWSPAGYYHEGWWMAGNSGFRGQVGANHRMLSTYLNSLIKHRLHIEEMREPVPGQDWSQRAPNKPPVPVYLVVRCGREG